jgi:hypothetical protein
MEPIREIWRSDDLEDVYRLRDALVLRGLEVQVLGAAGNSPRGLLSWGEMRIMVQERDMVYARWILAAAGADCWPEPQGERDEREVAPGVVV